MVRAKHRATPAILLTLVTLKKVRGALRVAQVFTGTPVTSALALANVVVFAAQIVVAGNVRYALAVPENVLRLFGANASLSTIADSRFETLVTSCFLHGSIMHLAFNLFALWQVGPLVERAVGVARFFSLYLAAGIAGSATSAIWGRFFTSSVSVGASGAVCGLIGAAIVLGLRTEGKKSELAMGMARWLGLLLIVGLLKYLRGDIVQVDNAAHIGGAIAGAMVATTWRQVAIPSRCARNATAAIVTACVVLVFASAVTVFVRNRTDPFLFLDVDGRLRVALEARRAGRCDRALAAMRRAVAMDPKGAAVRELDEEIRRDCANDAKEGRPAR
ncbi:MAG: rhomboid family intramembrane serine protease [Polyangiaceae bacterium]|nr:rhomboid family intramembrane serine protease [Polyangiaceae bacterium]